MADWYNKNVIELPSRPGDPMDFVKRGAVIAAIILVILILISFKPWFTVEPQQVGVVLRLGKFHRLVEPGFHWRLPYPVEITFTPEVQQVKRIEIGFRTVNPGPPAQYQHIQQESQMLTGDENVVVSEMIIQYRISDPLKYLFNVNNAEATLKDIGESAERQVIGDYAIDAALTWGRDDIQNRIQETAQELCNRYQMGIQIIRVQLQDTHPPPPVEPAFLAVWSAREDQSRFVNEAEGYRNSEIPKAEGEVQKIVQEAEGYRAERIAKSKGEVERFSSLLQEFQNAPEVTRIRLYLETMEKVLPGKSKVILENEGELWKLLDLTPKGLGTFFPKESTPEEKKP